MLVGFHILKTQFNAEFISKQWIFSLGITGDALSQMNLLKLEIFQLQQGPTACSYSALCTQTQRGTWGRDCFPYTSLTCGSTLGADCGWPCWHWEWSWVYPQPAPPWHPMLCLAAPHMNDVGWTQQPWAPFARDQMGFASSHSLGWVLAAFKEDTNLRCLASGCPCGVLS